MLPLSLALYLLLPLQADAQLQDLELVAVPSGSFEMGSADALTTAGRDHSDEGPVREVSLSAFSISKHEVSAELYRAFDPDFVLSEAHLPAATGVSWEDAVAFCTWLSERTGDTYRLPT